MIETANTLLNTEEEEYEAETRNDDWKRPAPCPQERQIRSLQDVSSMPSMYDEQELESENELADYFEERLAESPEDLMGEFAYNYDLSNDDLLDDDFFQRGIELAGPSSVDTGEEDQDQQLQESNEPMQAIYDTDEEGVENLIADEDSLNLLSVLYPNISYTCHEYGS